MAKTKILFISSTAPLPDQPSTQLPSIETFKAIEQVINLSKHRNQFEIKPEYNLSAGSIQETIMRYSPHIVHYFGHGEKGCLYFQNEDGNLEETKLKPFVDMFRIINEYQRRSGGDTIRLVILVACNSDRIAKAVSENVDCAIGMSNKMPVAAGIAFSEEFYAHLCEGRDVQCAFDLANCVRKLENLDEEEKPNIFPEGADFTALTFWPLKKGPIPPGPISPRSPFPKIKYTFKDYPEPFISKENNLDFIIAYGAGKRDYDEYLNFLKEAGQPEPECPLHPGRRGDFDHLPRLVADLSFYAAKKQISAQGKISNTGQFPFARQSFLMSNEEKKENIISIGSGYNNQITREIFEKYGEILPAKFEKPDSSQRLLFTGGDKKSYERDLVEDKNVGFIELVPNPYNPEKVVLIAAGLLHTGTQAAILALCRGIEGGLLDQTVEFKGKMENFPVQLLKATKIRYVKGNCIVDDFTLVH